jgi:hypothetical protein
LALKTIKQKYNLIAIYSFLLKISLIIKQYGRKGKRYFQAYLMIIELLGIGWSNRFDPKVSESEVREPPQVEVLLCAKL